jgi:hypothetical protein
MRAFVICLMVAGCANRPLPIDDKSENSDGAVTMCKGITPACVSACSSTDPIGKATCEEGSWQCEKGVTTTSCGGSCFGDSTRAEVCDDSGWQCQPSEVDFELCPAVMCYVCAGFSGPQTTAGCTCLCAQGQVFCNHVFP